MLVNMLLCLFPNLCTGDASLAFLIIFSMATPFAADPRICAHLL